MIANGPTAAILKINTGDDIHRVCVSSSDFAVIQQALSEFAVSGAVFLDGLGPASGLQRLTKATWMKAYEAAFCAGMSVPPLVRLRAEPYYASAESQTASDGETTVAMCPLVLEAGAQPFESSLRMWDEGVAQETQEGVADRAAASIPEGCDQVHTNKYGIVQFQTLTIDHARDHPLAYESRHKASSVVHQGCEARSERCQPCLQAREARRDEEEEEPHLALQPATHGVQAGSQYAAAVPLAAQWEPLVSPGGAGPAAVLRAQQWPGQQAPWWRWTGQQQLRQAQQRHGQQRD